MSRAWSKLKSIVYIIKTRNWLLYIDDWVIGGYKDKGKIRDMIKEIKETPND